MTDLNKLAEQIEQAKPEQQREMLGMAFDAAFPSPGPGSDDWARWFDIRAKWGRYMNADAFVDAALMFVPATAWVPGAVRVFAATPALAILAAALRAQAAKGDA